ncbi:MAG: tail fiber domain-containing protein [Phycisphaeraceae bacterium]|nr:tail fiber domain-containing protein [Phycisphaeraceae bacterium]
MKILMRVAAFALCPTLLFAGPTAVPYTPKGGPSPFEDRAAPSKYNLNDGPVTTAWTAGSGSEIIGVHAFQAVGSIDVLANISCKWGKATNGATARIFVWQDDGSGDINKARLLHEQNVTIQNAQLDIRNVYKLSKGVPVTGRFYIGCSTVCGPTDSPIAALNMSQPAGSVFLGVASPPFNAQNISSGSPGSVSSTYTLTLRAEGVNSGFTYQGKLAQAGVNYSGTADLRFEVFDSATGGSSLGPAQEIDNVAVAAGVFTVQVPQALSTFSNVAGNLWVEVSATTPSGNAAGWATISPRTPIAPVPMANTALVASKALNVDWMELVGNPWKAVTGGVSTAGALAVGTLSPGSPFHVFSNNATNTALIDSSHTVGTWLHLRNQSTSGRDWSLVSTGPANSEGPGRLLFFDGNAPLVRMLIDPAGSVGIGTIGPAARLHVDGGPLFSQMVVSANDANGVWLNLNNYSSNGHYWSLVSAGANNGEGAGSLLFRDTTVPATRMILTSAGRVGINTITPEQTLSVNGAVQILNSNLLAFGTVGNTLGTAENTDMIAFQRVNLTSGGTNSTELRLIIGDDNSSGASADYFTIGTIPGAIWNPTFGFRSDGLASKPGGGSWAAISDPRAKHDMVPLKGTLDRLLKLRGYEYFYNDDIVKSGKGLPGVQIGLMADEVERVFPDWVTRDANGLRAVSERATTALMVEALRDLRAEKDAQIGAQREEIASLRAKNAELEARLRAIEEKLAK